MKVGKAGAKLFKQYAKKLANTPLGKKIQNTPACKKLIGAYNKNPKKFGYIVGAGSVMLVLATIGNIADVRKEQNQKADFAQMRKDLDSLKNEVARMQKEQAIIKEKPVEEDAPVQEPLPSNYKTPVVGENGIAAVDTTCYYGKEFYTSDRKPLEITYYSDKNKKNPVYKEELNEDGSLKSYSNLYPSVRKGYYDETEYSSSGEYIGNTTYNLDGSYKYSWKGKDGHWNSVTHDVNGRPIIEDYSGQDAVHYTYLKNGGHTEETRNYDGVTTGFVEKDKDNRTVRQKYFKKGVLDYTVYPKRDSEGSVIKNDTVYNNEK